MTDNSQKAQCKHCFHFLSVGSNTTLKNHISHPHCEAKKAQQNQNPEAGQTSMSRDGSVFRYDPDYLREQFAGLVIQRALPFNLREKRGCPDNYANQYTHVPNQSSQTSGGATSSKRKQDKCPLETPLDFEECVFDDEVQQNEAIPLSDEEIALDARSEGPGEELGGVEGPREELRKSMRSSFHIKYPHPLS
ncbi:hypothetical protein Tco_0653352 [Tanacetum coccineum]|uniref:BED-type domain-containing protein n=1 Tax=Tanacetum coccineum TaxID=301880 RepID=A0ABQ4X0K3_9ASTR